MVDVLYMSGKTPAPTYQLFANQPKYNAKTAMVVVFTTFFLTIFAPTDNLHLPAVPVLLFTVPVLLFISAALLFFESAWLFFEPV